MKFPYLPIGQRFSYKEKTYTKTGPLTASEEGTGKSQLIMKSAEVTPLDLLEKPVEKQLRQFSANEVREMFANHHKQLRSALLEQTDQHGSLMLDQVLQLIDEQGMPGELD